MTGVVSVLRDVTAQKQAMDALAASEARYRLLAEHSSDLIVHTEPDGTIVYASPACRMLGYALEDMVGRLTREFLHPEDQAENVPRRAAYLADEHPPNGDRRELRVLRKDGGYQWMETHTSAVRGPTARSPV